jgi:hypothetical protein
MDEEHKAKIRAAHLGKKKPWVAARNRSQEVRMRPKPRSAPLRSRGQTSAKHPLGPLVNLTEGGEGLTDPSPEVRAQISSKVSLSLKGNQRRKGKLHDDATKALIGKKSLGRTHTPEAKAKIGASFKGRPLSDEHRAKLKEAWRRRRDGIG